LWSGLETLGTLVIGLASVIVIARLIGPDAFGLASIGLGLTLVVIVFISSLVHDGLVRSPDYDDRQLDSAFSFSLLAGIAAALALALLALPLARLLDEPALTPVLLAFLPMVLFGALSAPLVAERRRALDFPTLGRHQLTTRSLGLALGLAMAATGFGVWSVVGQQLATTGLLMLSLTAKRKGLPGLRIDWRALRPILVFSRNIALTGLVVQLTERLFLTLVGWLYGLAAAGQWAVASRLVETVNVVLSQLIYHVALAHMAALREAKAALARTATLNRDLLILVALPGLTAVAAAAEPLVRLLFGAGWEAVPGLMVWMLLGAVFVMRRLLAQVAMNVLGRSETTLYAFAAESAVALALLALLSPLGLTGAAAARGLSFAVGWLVIFYRAGRALDLPLLRESLGLALDLAVILGVIALTHWLLADVAFTSPWTAILSEGGLAFGLALGLLVACRLALVRELARLLSEMRGRDGR
jgi:O-antigen/teichoic acid export membrane protein